MNTSALREKIIDRFNDMIEDPCKLVVLEGILDSISSNTKDPQVPEEHYKVVRERRERYHSGETTGSSWEEVKQRLIDKNGL